MHVSTGEPGTDQVLLMGVEQFPSSTDPHAEPEPGRTDWSRLAFVPGLMSRLDLAYKLVGYDVKSLTDPDRRTVTLCVDDAVNAPTTRIVHAISHGAPAADLNRSPAAAGQEHIHMVPTCATFGPGTDVSQWVRTAHQQPEPTLFIIDLCRAGRAARLSELTRVPDGELNAWVIAATSPDLPAYDGRFSEAVAEVLEHIAAHGLDTSPSVRFVRWDRVTRAIQKNLDALGSRQVIHTTRVDVSQDLPELPFFPNPRWRPDDRLERLNDVAPAVRAFVADLDAEHFMSRVGDHFVGRQSQLEWLAAWLDDNRVGGLRVVTGAPGSGKSALLGALVCSGHEAVIDAAPDIRAYLTAQNPEGVCSPNPLLAAIHSRGRGIAPVLHSIAMQWKLPIVLERQWTVADLISEVGALPGVPALVFDALDEAEDPDDLMNSLLIPLARAVRSDGRPLVRLLVGTRRWRSGPLLALAEQDAGLLDLDDVPVEEIRRDLQNHVLRRLSSLPHYGAPEQRPVRAALAATVAGALTEEADRMNEWGPFLVARIFGHVLATEPAPDSVEAAIARGRTVPRSLPGVLELDIENRPDSKDLRAVLAAVAFAKGDGFPTEAVAAVAPEFAPETDDAPGSGLRGTTGQDLLRHVRGLLDAGSFYLRTGVETDGSALYRLFHQGLADYLQVNPYPLDSAPRSEAT